MRLTPAPATTAPGAMTLSNMHENGVRAVTAACAACRHKADVVVDQLDGNAFVSKSDARQCSACGGKRLRRWRLGIQRSGRALSARTIARFTLIRMSA
jgi:hypothetical protein